jgi:hypothetical protein
MLTSRVVVAAPFPETAGLERFTGTALDDPLASGYPDPVRVIFAVTGIGTGDSAIIRSPATVAASVKDVGSSTVLRVHPKLYGPRSVDLTTSTPAAELSVTSVI